MQLILSNSVITIMVQAKLFSTHLALISRYLDGRNTDVLVSWCQEGRWGWRWGAVVGAVDVPFHNLTWPHPSLLSTS